MYGWSSICLFCLSESFIILWLGEQYLMGKKVLFLIVFNFLINGLMAPIDSIKSAAGIYHPDRYIPLISAIVNMVISIALVKSYGISGVFIGTLISTILFNFWIKPVLVYKKIFKKNYTEYFLDILLKIGSILVVGFICFILGDSINNRSVLLEFIFKLLICFIVPNVLVVITMYKTKEFKYIYGILKGIVRKISFKISNIKVINNNEN